MASNERRRNADEARTEARDELDRAREVGASSHLDSCSQGSVKRVEGKSAVICSKGYLIFGEPNPP